MNLLSKCLAEPERIRQLDTKQWDDVLRQARYAGMLGVLHGLVEQQGFLEAAPPEARDILVSARVYADHMQLIATRDLRALAKVLREFDGPVVLLKGCAYVVAGLPAATGRRLSDIDVLVPRGLLPKVEQTLVRAGWSFDEGLSDYDRQYYENWTHELPPMRQVQSSLELDVHHNLLQLSGRIKIDPELLFSRCEKLDGGIYSRLSPEDMLLHSACHLFMSDELRGGLRDLFDMHQLARYFSEKDPDYWVRTANRARELGVQRPLYYAASSMRRLLNTPVPEAAWVTVEHGMPNVLVDAVMRRLIDQHLAPQRIGSAEGRRAEWLLYVRSHWVRMPPLTLLRHLTAKWWMRRREPGLATVPAE